MDSLMKAAENFSDEAPRSEETFDENLFLEFMKKVPIWDFFCVTKQVYLKMAEQEKREKISQYYSAMKSRHVPAGELNLYFFIFIFNISVCLFRLGTIKRLQGVSLTEFYSQTELLA